MTPQQFLLILRARWKVVLITLLAIAGITLAVSLVLPKQYQAVAAVVVDSKSPDALNGVVMGGNAGSYIATQVDIINSDRVAQTVVRNLKLEQNPIVLQQWQDDTGGQGDVVVWLSDLLRKTLDVRPSRDSNVISIAFTGVEPQFAAAVANAFAQTYIDVNLDLGVAPARQFATFFEEQTKTARSQVERSQKTLSDYLQKHGITATDDRLDYETAKLNETSSQLTTIQALTTDSQSKRGKTDTVAEVVQNPLINGLKADVARQEAKLKDITTNLGDNHPQTQRSLAELDSLKAQLAMETRRILSSIETTYQVGRQRESQLQSALATQKAKVLVLNQQRDELSVLRRDVEVAQRTFDQVSLRASQTSIESQANQTNVALLNQAVAPLRAASPRVLLNTAIAVFLGAVLGIGLALALELLHRRIRSADDLVEMIDLPLLGRISHEARGGKALALGAPA